MHTRRCLAAVVVLAVFVTSGVRAAERDGAASPAPAPANPANPPATRTAVSERPGPADAPGASNGPALERLMDYVKRTNPAEYERLSRLQHENPTEFREILRRRFQEAAESHRRMQPGWRPRGDATAAKPDRENPEAAAPKGDRPKGDAARNRPAGTPDADRNRVAVAPDAERDREGGGERVRAAGAAGGHGVNRARGVEDSPEYRATMEEVRQLCEEYRRKKSADRQDVEQRIRAKVESLFDLRERERASQLDRMEKEIVRLRKELDGRKELRTKIVDRRLDEILGRDKTQW